MKVSTTERGMFRRCRRQWDYSSFNRQALSRIVPKTALSLGRAMHEAHARWLLDPNTPLREHFMAFTIEDLEELGQAYQAQVGAPISEVELTGYYEGVELGLAICDNYQAFYNSPLPEGFQLIAPEQKVEVQIPGTEHWLEGRLDALLANDSGLFVLERKTYGRRPRLDILQMNDQFLSYTWIATRLQLGPVHGLAYDGMWKRAEPPRGKSMEDLFLRRLLIRPPEELEEFETHLRWQVEEMASDPPLYINRQWQGCWDCEYEALCTAQSRGEDTEYALKQYTQRIKHD